MLRSEKTLKRALSALAAAALFVPSVASAQDLGAWRACAADQPITDKNVTGQLDQDPTQDEIVLDFDDSVSDADIKAMMKAHGLDVHLNSVHADDDNLYVATVPEGAVPTIKACLSELLSEGTLEVVEENMDYKLFAETFEGVGIDAKPNDPLYQFQWHFEQVNAEDAWKVSTGRDVVVAVIDTGVAVENNSEKGVKKARDLMGTQIVPGYDFVDNSNYVFDGHGHGTHVAGTIAQTTNNKYGVAGLAYNAKIMGVRVLNSRGFGQTSDIADSIRWSADNGAQVINMSLGGPLPSLVLKRAIDYAHKKGVTVVAAAGNSGRRSPSYPASYNHVISVAATQFDKNTTFYSQWNKHVDIAAPGGNTRVDQNNDGRPDGVLQQTLDNGKLDKHDFLLFMGTSMASPHVAAGAAMVISQGVTHPDKVEQILKATADSSLKDRFDDEQEFRERYGAGLMQVDKAVTKANTTQGGLRLTLGLLFALLAAGAARRKDMLGLGVQHKALLFGTAGVVASGLFVLPLVFGDACWVQYLSRPLAEMDILLFGLESHQNPLMASALLPIAAYGFFGHRDKLGVVACGLALGMAAFGFSEVLYLTSDVRMIPGMDLLDRAWLGANALVSFGIGYFGLRRA